jgi:hypothetical protein
LNKPEQEQSPLAQLYCEGCTYIGLIVVGAAFVLPSHIPVPGDVQNSTFMSMVITGIVLAVLGATRFYKLSRPADYETR